MAHDHDLHHSPNEILHDLVQLYQLCDAQLDDYSDCNYWRYSDSQTDDSVDLIHELSLIVLPHVLPVHLYSADEHIRYDNNPEYLSFLAYCDLLLDQGCFFLGQRMYLTLIECILDLPLDSDFRPDSFLGHHQYFAETIFIFIFLLPQIL